MPQITSVTVAFNPDAARLREQVEALRGEVDAIVIVDNGSETPVARIEGARIIRLDTNAGLARGFNVGVAAAREGDAKFVLLLDDDSVPEKGMAARLVAACRSDTAAAGPRIRDPRDERDYPFIRLGWLGNHHQRCESNDGVIDCDFLISSGSLIPLEALGAVGGFDEGLFIDSVDLEWCCRARSQGFGLIGVCGARLDHRLGDRRQSVMNAFELVVHSPERIYYMTRNRFLLYRRDYMPLKWKVKDVLRWMGKFGATILLIPPRLEYLRMTVRALRDAVGGRTGKLEAR
jgi:rhamnosyltransferase